MNWMLASIAASLFGAGGPLFMVESIPSVRRLPDLERPRRSLRIATAVALLLVGVWFALDHVAVSAGERSFVVAGVSAALFFILFIALGYPILHRAARALPGHRETPTAPLLGARLDVPVLIMLLASAAAFAVSPNDLGHRTKGVAIVMAGVVLYFLGRPRAPRTFLLFALSGAITLFAQWHVPWQSAVGALSQLSVGVVGLAWCARLLMRYASEGSEANRPA
jgi:hypothetical protein